VTRRVRKSGLAWALAVVAAGVGWAPPSQAAEVVHCGQVITRSLTVANDVGPCAGDGLIVRANDITVDLNGHVARGAGFANPSSIDSAGVRLDSVTGVTVRSGTVREFAVGVLVLHGSGNTISGITAADNVGRSFATYGDGINLDASSDNTVIGSTVTGNGPFAGIDMTNDASGNHIANNHVADNHVVATFEFGDCQCDDGIAVAAGSFNVISGNVVERNGEFGIAMAGRDASHDQALDNISRDNGNFGINAGGSGGHLVSNNVVTGNGFDRFAAPSVGPQPFNDGGVAACGTCFGPGDLTTIQDNVVTGNGGIGVFLGFNGNEFLGGTGIFGTFPPRPYQAPRSNLVQRNQVRDNTGDGIFVECEKVFDASFNSTCLTDSPPHHGLRILDNTSLGNGGAKAGAGAWDLHDGNVNCDHNIWAANKAVTANPPCTLAGSSPTTTSTTSTTRPTTTTTRPPATTTTTIANACAQQVEAQRKAVNAQITQQEVGQSAATVAALEQSRALANANFDRQLAAC
jgi:parallel beta-helix repeat protein